MRHVVSEQEVRARLAELPASLLESLEFVQLSRMTKKKQSFPCYGMQWGSTLYLYPIEESLVEYFSQPPRPAEFNEAMTRFDDASSAMLEAIAMQGAVQQAFTNLNRSCKGCHDKFRK